MTGGRPAVSWRIRRGGAHRLFPGAGPSAGSGLAGLAGPVKARVYLPLAEAR